MTEVNEEKIGYRVRPTPTNAATLKNSAFVTLTLRTSPDDWRTNSFGVVVRCASDPPVSATISSSSSAIALARQNLQPCGRDPNIAPIATISADEGQFLLDQLGRGGSAQGGGRRAHRCWGLCACHARVRTRSRRS